MEKMSGDAKAWIICISIIALTVIFVTIGVTIQKISFDRLAVKNGYEQITVPQTSGSDIVWRKCVKE